MCRATSFCNLHTTKKNVSSSKQRCKLRQNRPTNAENIASSMSAPSPVMPQRDKQNDRQTDRQQTANFSVFHCRRRRQIVTTLCKQIYRSSPYHVCTPNFSDRTSSFGVRGSENLGEFAPPRFALIQKGNRPRGVTKFENLPIFWPENPKIWTYQQEICYNGGDTRTSR